MQYSMVLASILAVAAAHKNGTYPVYTTEVVTAYTTYCPEPTKIVHGGNTYTVTKATTLTITDCPCTVTKPILSSSVVTACPTCVAPVPTGPVSPPVITHAPYPSANATRPAAPPVGTGSVTPAPPAFTGAANALSASGAGLAAVFGLAAYIL